MGVGLRHALEKGIHRRTGPPTVESEMQKRAFWYVTFCGSSERNELTALTFL